VTARFRVISDASSHPPGTRCAHCDRPLKGKVVMLELDQRDDSYHDRGDVPAEHSQGWFPFGFACARKVTAEPPA
jgi:hypothetical protein